MNTPQPTTQALLDEVLRDIPNRTLTPEEVDDLYYSYENTLRKAQQRYPAKPFIPTPTEF